MTDADIESTRAPLIEHLIELRARLIKALLAFVAMFVVCFFFAKNIYNILLVPYEHAAGPSAKLIFTAPQEYFFTQIQVALFAAAFLACPVIFAQIYTPSWRRGFIGRSGAPSCPIFSRLRSFSCSAL